MATLRGQSYTDSEIRAYASLGEQIHYRTYMEWSKNGKVMGLWSDSDTELPPKRKNSLIRTIRWEIKKRVVKLLLRHNLYKPLETLIKKM